MSIRKHFKSISIVAMLAILICRAVVGFSAPLLHWCAGSCGAKNALRRAGSFWRAGLVEFGFNPSKTTLNPRIG